MATLRSRPWNDYNTNYGPEAWFSSCPCKPKIPNYSLRVKNQRIGASGLAHLWQKWGMRSRKRYLVAQSYGSEVLREAYAVSEEDNRFVSALREVQPYIFLNRGRTFVVMIAGEIVASLYFDAILQVNMSLLITHFVFFFFGKNYTFCFGQVVCKVLKWRLSRVLVRIKEDDGWLISQGNVHRKRIPTQ